MLNSEIKRKIDNARDILVWKIPVPSQQIEQITIALIYKFMSDIDLQDKELWWEGFFQWEFEKYSWNNIMDRKIGGQERLNLYSEWLDKMGTNPHLPQMFRDIFRNAYLPFKDPSTLDMFLKQIDEFSYDHSEDLGDAFEYLLSTAWSQWDAGQFRTPRHIIDFIVSIVQPQLTDTVLDPACGTAWFLISAYKYIMNQNKDKVAWDKLSLTQKKELTQHFVWYDISYEMVRLSLVNMYLHNFWDPKIFEYDTLSNDDRWDDRFDCILANPPFMTPKGWIQPHNRFSIKASKSEVLFVDYMIEHLNPHGKAWIVVPEGIIFQWANAYKDLRKKMIKENFLWAVVSLPAWVFQPYSWVKTSILLFDQELAKKTDKILFVKVQNDGFDLWAQRRPSNKNDLPKATEILLQYKKDLLAWNEINLPDSEMTLLVSKEKIEENSEFNLSMDRYKSVSDYSNIEFEMVEIWSLFDSWRWRVISKIDISEHEWIFPVYSSQTLNNWILWYIDTFDFEWEYITWTTDWANAWTVFYRNWKFNCTNVCWTLKLKPEYEWKISLWFVARVLNHEAYKYVVKVGNPKLMNKDMEKIKIPVPPLEVQEKIVAELDSYQKVIDWAKMIVDNYKPTIKINPDWEMVKLGDVADFIRGPFWWSLKKEIFVNDGYLVYEQNHAINWDFSFWRYYITEDKYNEMSRFSVKTWDLLISCSWTMWKVSIVPENHKKWIINQALLKLTVHDKISNNYLKYLLESPEYHNRYFSNQSWAIIQNVVWVKELKEIEIPLPSLEEQNQIVAEIEREESMVESAKQLIGVFEKKIKDRIDEIWGK